MDLAVNTMAYLAQEKDIVSIKPKKIIGTRMFLTSVQRNAVIVFCIFLPLFFFIFSGFLWYRRKNS